MKRFLTLILFFFVYFNSTAQDATLIDIAAITESKSIIPITELYIDSTASLSAGDVMMKTFWPLQDFKFRKAIPDWMICYGYYLKFKLINNADTANTIYLRPGALFEKFILYKISQPPFSVSTTDDATGYGKLLLTAHEQTTILVYLLPVKTEKINISPQLINENFLAIYNLSLQNSRSDLKIFGYVLSGIMLMMILFMGTNYFFSKKKEFLYNAVYSFCMFLLIFLNSYLLKTTTRFTNFFMSYFDFFLLMTGTVFFILFTRKFLDTSTKFLLLDKVLKYGSWFIILSLLIYTYLNFFTNFYLAQTLLENIIKLVTLGIGVYFIVLALKRRSHLLNYIAAGNAALVFFSAISLGIILSEKNSFNLFTSSSFYLNLGIVIEVTFFLLGLTYKNRKELIERIKEQETLKLLAKNKEFETQIAIMKAQQEDRNRISADMHDDLGAGMTTIRLYSELAKSKLGSNTIPEIEKISSSSDELLNKMNAIIWSMSSSNDSLGNMTAYIRSYAIEYFENTGISCKIIIPDNLANIEVIGEIRRNVFLVVKEALNNIVKHSKATEVVITLVKLPGALTLYIQDNGIGINFNELRQFSNGLKNMKKRMADVNFDFTIENKNGTLVTLHRKINNF